MGSWESTTDDEIRNLRSNYEPSMCTLISWPEWNVLYTIVDRVGKMTSIVNKCLAIITIVRATRTIAMSWGFVSTHPRRLAPKRSRLGLVLSWALCVSGKAKECSGRPPGQYLQSGLNRYVVTLIKY